MTQIQPNFAAIGFLISRIWGVFSMRSDRPKRREIHHENSPLLRVGSTSTIPNILRIGCSERGDKRTHSRTAEEQVR